MNSATTNYRFVSRIPGDALAKSALLYDAALNGCGGINPQNGIRRYPESCLKLPSTWLAEFERKAGGCSGPVFVQTWRNIVQNRRCPAFSRETGLCQSEAEKAERSIRCYYGVATLDTG